MTTTLLPPLAPIIFPQSKQKNAREPERTWRTKFVIRFKLSLLTATHPQSVERYDPLGAMDHLKTGSDRQLKSHVEDQMTCLQVEQAVRQVAPPVTQGAVPGMILKVMEAWFYLRVKLEYFHVCR